MNRLQKLVEEFHRKFGLTVGDSPELRDADWYFQRLSEEVVETLSALKNRDIVALFDGLCDMMYVAYGAAVVCGVDMEPLFEEVHHSNMRKSPELDASGKLSKPKGWRRPRIRMLLDRQIRVAQRRREAQARQLKLF